MTAPEVADGTTTLVDAIRSESSELGITWGLRPGTVQGRSFVPGFIDVLLDNDTKPVQATTLAGAVNTGARVMTLRVPPSGMYIIGRIGFAGVQRAVKLANQTHATNDNILQADNALFGYAEAGQTYQLRLNLYAFATTTADFAIAFDAPAGSFGTWRPINHADNTVQVSTTYSTASKLGFNTSGVGTGVLIEISGWITTPTPGLVTLYWAKNTAELSTATLGDTSWFELGQLS